MLAHSLTTRWRQTLCSTSPILSSTLSTDARVGVKEVPNQSMDTLIEGIDGIWCGIRGPMKELIIDCETAIFKGWETKEYFRRKGISVIIRAPGQHARFVERRGTLLRYVLHKVDAQLEREGITDIPFLQRLSESTFSGNALSSINDTTPYNAVYCRVPQMLPDIKCTTLDGTGTMPGTMRHSHRLREVAVQRMVEHTAPLRIQRALNTTTIVAGGECFQVHDMVDDYRPPTQKGLALHALPAWPNSHVALSKLATTVVSLTLRRETYVHT